MLLIARENTWLVSAILRKKVEVQKPFSIIGAKVWNSLPDKLRSTKILKEFKKAVRELHL